jgi:O-antigen/teichoic acid export membrane protein
MISKLVHQINQDASLKEITRKGGSFFAFKVSALLLNYLFAVIVVRYYGESVFGFVTLGFTVLMIVSAICRFGFDIVITKVFAFDDQFSYRGVYRKSSIFAGILSVLAGLLLYFYASELASSLFQKPDFAPYLRWIGITVPIWTLLPINAAVFRGLRKNNLFAFFGSFGRFLLTLTALGVIILFFSEKQWPQSPLIAHGIGLAVLLLGAMLIVRLLIKRMPHVKEASFGQQLKVSFPIFLSTTMMITLLWVDKLLLGAYVEESLVGIYEIALKLAFLIGFNLEAINSILSPKVSQAFANGNMKRMQQDIQFSVRLSVMISLATLAGLLLFSDYILLFFGEDFLKGKPVLLVVCIGQLINVLCGPVANIMQMTGHQAALSRIFFIALIGNVLLNIWLIPTQGILGAAIATTITYAWWNLAGAVYIYRKLGVRSFFYPFKTKTNEP